ncbi:HAD family hydrolase [Streptomyces sp. NPDC005706]|uniref:HAD family hydrolase n=1 Tax=Streptomyces sp. NPDC005706 TaxID=3157169 RepID=UPI0033FCA94D
MLRVTDLHPAAHTIRLGKRPHPIPLDPAFWAMLERCLVHRAAWPTANPRVAVTKGTKAGRSPASTDRLSDVLDDCGYPPRTIRRTRLVESNTMDPELVVAAFGMGRQGTLIYLADHVDPGRETCLEITARGLLPIMPLLMLDLDNTLVDRDAAFRDAATAFLAEHRLPGTDLTWVMTVDASGYTARHDVAAAMIDRYRGMVPATAIHALLDHGAADRVVLTAFSREALDKARAGGWTCVIVTNGRTAQQEAKIRHTGLDQLVQGWVISETVGRKKPESAIFLAAADAVGVPLTGAWVIGDSPHADIEGARTLGLRSVWVSNGQPWAQDSYQPTHVAEDVATAIDYVISASR